MSTMELFTEDEDEMLITMVSQHPILYDLSMPDYKNARKKDRVWLDIAEQLNKTSLGCKKHWKNLKDTFYRQKRKNKSGTGSAAPKNPRSKFGSYEKLFSFLDTVPQTRNTINSSEPDNIIQESQNTEINTQAGPSFLIQEQSDDRTETSRTEVTSPTTLSPVDSRHSNPVNFPKSNRKRQKKDDILTYLQKREESRQKTLDNLNKRNDDDEISSFSEHVKSVLIKLPRILQLKAKKDIFDILMTYEFLVAESENSIYALVPMESSTNTTCDVVSCSSENFPMLSPNPQLNVDKQDPASFSQVQRPQNVPQHQGPQNLSQHQGPQHLSQHEGPQHLSQHEGPQNL